MPPLDLADRRRYRTQKGQGGDQVSFFSFLVQQVSDFLGLFPDPCLRVALNKDMNQPGEGGIFKFTTEF